jgi:L-2-hydroxyglutarate oxidase LhgO
MSETFEIDCAVIGAGVVGLACARALALAGREVVVLEAEAAIGTHTSSRNSEVIHAGLYYAEGSFKARFCVAGRRALYDYLDARNIDYRRCGKLVVALDDDEAQALEALKERAERNGVEQLEIIDGAAARRLEPALSQDVRAAMHSPVSGIFDSHGYMLALLGDLEAAGGSLALATPLIEGRLVDDAIILQTGGEAPARLKARTVVNCAGHQAVDIAARIKGPHVDGLPEMHFVKGSYFSLTGHTPFSRLIYPMPGTSSLGLHLTVDLSGRGRLGPDAQWLPDGAQPPFDYRVDPARADHFLAAVQDYWPGLQAHQLNADYAGVRPKLVGPGEPSGDFRIEGLGEHGTPGLVNLFGIESPGLTSSLAIADHVAEIAP